MTCSNFLIFNSNAGEITMISLKNVQVKKEKGIKNIIVV